MDTGNEPPVPATPEPAHGGHTRDGTGRFTHNYTTAQRDARAAELRDEGWTLQAIADELGYHDKSHARQGIRRALREVVRGPAEQLLAREAERLDTLYEEALEVLQRNHLTVSHGKVIKDDDGNVLLDDGPKLAAIDRLVKIRESYRKLFGLDAPSRVSVDAQQLGDEISALLNRATADDDNST
jgi:AraC-like DNA-binding protein